MLAYSQILFIILKIYFDASRIYLNLLEVYVCHFNIDSIFNTYTTIEDI